MLLICSHISRGNRLAHRSRILARRAQAGEDRVRILIVEREKLDDLFFARFAVPLLEDFRIARRIDEGLPLVRRRQRQIELQMKIDVDETRHILRALDIARHPVNGIGNAAQQRTSFADS